MTRRYMTQYEFWDKQMKLEKELRKQVHKENMDALRPITNVIFLIIVACLVYGVLFPQ